MDSEHMQEVIYIESAPPRGEQSQRAHDLLARALQEQYGLADFRLATGAHGKPYLPDHPALHFNISHCRTAVACAVSREPVGIDIESIREAKPHLVTYTMNAEEQALISASPDPNRAFTRLWTRKEAYLKLLGTGIGGGKVQDTLNQDVASIDTVEKDKYIYSVARYKQN